MKLGFVPTTGSAEVIDAGRLVELVQHAEAVGFDSVWATEHILWDTPRLDPYALLAGYSTVTRRVELGVGICVLPLHNPTLIAKVVSTIDHLSEGRAILGVAIGEHSPREFIAFGIRPNERGRRLEEGVEIIRALWSQDHVTYVGEFHRLEDATMYPKPVRRPLPIWVGGTSIAALRRAARIGDGWYSFRSTPRQIASGRLVIAAEAERTNRDLSGFTIGLQVNCVLAANAQIGREAAARHYQAMSRTWGRIGPSLLDGFEAHTLVGAPDDVVAGLRAYRDAGVDHLTVRLVAPPSEIDANLDVFAREVMPSVRA